MTTNQMTINGFTFKVCNTENSFSERYYQATNGEVTITSKSLQYLIGKVKKLPFTFVCIGENYNPTKSQYCPF
jgi:hypothetical protein